MLNVQKFLEENSLNDLKKKHAINCRIADHKVILNYDQIHSRPGDRLAEECRGLILRKQNKSAIYSEEKLGPSKILNFGFKRFYNYGDPACSKIDWGSAKIQEKLDGSLISMYFDDVKSEWHAATRKILEADMKVNAFDMTFRELFERALIETSGMKFEEFTSLLVPEMTYLFELCTPFNRVIVNHEGCRIHLIGMRQLLPPFREYNPKESLLPFPTPIEFELSSIDDVLSFVNNQKPTEQEGVVIVDKNFNRIKIKSISYVTYNKLHDTLGNSPRNCLISILEEKDDDIYPFMPSPIQRLLNSIKSGLTSYLSFFEEKIVEGLQFAGEDDPKLFADWASRECAMDAKLWAAPLFAIYRGKATSLPDWIEKSKRVGKYNNNQLDQLLERLDYKK